MHIKDFLFQLESVRGATPQQRLAKLRELAETSELDIETIARIDKALFSRKGLADVREKDSEISATSTL